MKKKRYILYTRTRSKYEDFYRYHFKIFNDYFELQKNLMHYWYINKNDYTIFEETNLAKDYSLNDIKRGIR